MNETDKIQRSFNLLRLEMVLSSMLISLPILNLFWHEYAGLDQFGISISQAAFMVVMIIMDIPTGVIADKFSRKWANVLGDLITGMALIGYAFANSLLLVILAEVVFAIGAALSNGADGPLFEQYCEKLGRDYAHEKARISKAIPLSSAASVIVGGLLGAVSVRLTMLVTAIPMLCGAVFSFLLTEDRTWLEGHGLIKRRKLREELKATLKGTKNVVVYAMHGHKELAATIWAQAVLNESTHGLVWVTTPLLLAAGLPVWLVGAGWALLNVSASAGAWLAQRFASSLSTKQVVLYALIPFVAACVVLGFRANLFTIVLVSAFGLMRGWNGAITPARVQLLSPRHIKSSTASVASTLSRALYVPLVLLIGQSGQTSVGRALLLNAAIFAAAAVVLVPRLKARA